MARPYFDAEAFINSLQIIRKLEDEKPKWRNR